MNELWAHAPMRLNRWIASWILSLSNGERVKAVDITPREEKLRFVRAVAEEVLIEPVAVRLFGPSASFDQIVRLDHTDRNEPLGGYVHLCEHGAFHFLPGGSLIGQSPSELIPAFGRGVGTLLAREKREEAAERLYEIRVLLVIAAIGIFMLGYQFGQAMS